MIEEVTSATCLALLSRPGNVLNAYQSLLAGVGVEETLYAPNVTALFQKLPETPISGIVADLPVVVRASSNEKLLLEEAQQIFPNIRVNYQAQAGVRVLFADAALSGEESLRAFVEKTRSFPPRSLRKNQRQERHLNVMMWREGEEPEKARRAFTMDVSLGGIFASTCDPNPPGTKLWMLLPDLDPAPFRVKVRWERCWGTSRSIPGFGAEFEELTEAQQRVLADLLS